jgi:hypothetical protein
LACVGFSGRLVSWEVKNIWFQCGHIVCFIRVSWVPNSIQP